MTRTSCSNLHPGSSTAIPVRGTVRKALIAHVPQPASRCRSTLICCAQQLQILAHADTAKELSPAASTNEARAPLLIAHDRRHDRDKASTCKQRAALDRRSSILNGSLCAHARICPMRSHALTCRVISDRQCLPWELGAQANRKVVACAGSSTAQHRVKCGAIFNTTEPWDEVTQMKTQAKMQSCDCDRQTVIGPCRIDNSLRRRITKQQVPAGTPAGVPPMQAAKHLF